MPCLGDSWTRASGTDVIHLVVGCDDSYARHLAVMLLSLFARSLTLPVQVHVLAPPGFASRNKLEEALGQHASKLVYYKVDPQNLPGLGRPDISVATYYRLLIAEVLAPDLDRVIYLDCDMLVCCDLVELWDQPLGEFVVGAVTDPGFRHHEVLGLPEGAGYFNAGVLLIDLKRWRAAGIGREALAFRVAHPERISHDDQCALNWLLLGRWAKLDETWNVQAQTLGKLAGGQLHYFHPMPVAGREARIVHFNFPARPWTYMDEHPFKPFYLVFQAKTPWRSERPTDRYPHNIIIKALRRHTPALLPIYNHMRKYV